VKGRVLIADDSGFMRNALREMLESAGFDVVGEAQDGAEAVAAFERLRPDIVMVDLVMPRQSGIDVVREIRRLDPCARIVMCSARGLETLVMEALQEGALDYIVKPLRAAFVLPTLRAALEKGR
jgi:two-component system chemotaxis response regulator CheY